MMFILKYIAIALFLALFIYSKIKPIEDKLFPENKKKFGYIKQAIEPALEWLNKYIKPYEIGQGYSISLAQFVLAAILILIIII